MVDNKDWAYWYTDRYTCLCAGTEISWYWYAPLVLVYIIGICQYWLILWVEADCCNVNNWYLDSWMIELKLNLDC